jgi:hypothetical protein
MSAVARADISAQKPFAATLLDLLDRVEYRRVNPDDQFDPVYRLRYEAYRREAFVPANDEQIVRDEFEELPNAYCYGVYLDGRLVSSVRFHHMTREFRMAPSYSVFPDVLDPLIEAGHTMIDPGRFTADYEASLAFPALPYLTLRIPTMAVKHFRVKYCLSTVRPEHAAFYRRIYRSQLFGAARYYHGLTFPMELWACDCPVVYPGLVVRYPFFDSTAKEREALFGPLGRTHVGIRPTARVASGEMEPA